MPPGLLETALPAPQDPDARASADTLLPAAGHRPPPPTAASFPALLLRRTRDAP